MSGWLPTSPCTPEACAGHPGKSASPARAAFRLGTALTLVLLAVAATPPVRLLPDRPRRALVRAWAAALVRSMGVRITVRGTAGSDGAPEGRLIVANHISWLDVPLVAAVLPGRMLAKSEIGGWPVLGRLAARAGTLFIERDRIRALPRTVEALAGALRAGDRVTVFPEGSTWCGRAQGPFRRAAFQSALDARVPVQPVRIAYRLADGEPAGAPAFVGEDPLTASLWRIARARGIRAEVRLLPRIPPGRHSARRDLAEAAWRAVLGDAAQELPPPAGVPARRRPGAAPDQPPATDRDSAKRPAASVHQCVSSSPAFASSSRTPS
ncbi:lysophospholipid acyltransferase family protein [Streptomyces sp. NPDC012794]|uniref:lysophospholipid acyltransferase family protein n=1 Tax=Streptomyces sp. NPDC012794 TaxID=3364850 RepID=UPI0036A7475E